MCALSRTEQEAAARANGRQVRFLANVDPVDVARALNGFDQEETLVVVVSKTFTTAETMLNARTVRCGTLTAVDIQSTDRDLSLMNKSCKSWG